MFNQRNINHKFIPKPMSKPCGKTVNKRQIDLAKSKGGYICWWNYFWAVIWHCEEEFFGVNNCCEI